MHKWLNPSEPPLRHVYQGESKNGYQGRGDDNAESMWKRLPHSAWKRVMLKGEMLWEPVLNRHIALTLLSWVPPSQSLRQKLFGDVVTGSLSRDGRDGMEKG